MGGYELFAPTEKKTGVAEPSEGFRLAGLLVNGPPSPAGLPFTSSSDVFYSKFEEPA